MAVTGIAASGGKALATVFVYVPPKMAAEKEQAEGLTAEQVMAQVNAAIEWVDQAMAQKIEHAKGQGREILEMQRVMLNDSMLLSGIEEAAQEGKSAAAAVAVSTAVYHAHSGHTGCGAATDLPPDRAKLPGSGAGRRPGDFDRRRSSALSACRCRQRKDRRRGHGQRQ